MTLTKTQESALKDFLQFCNVKELRLALTTKVLTSDENNPITFDTKERHEFSFLYRFLETIDSKG